MNRILSFLLFFSVLSLSAQTDITPRDASGKPHGLWKKFYEKGSIRFEGRFNHGVEQDTFKFYFEDGTYKALNVFSGQGKCYSKQYGGENKIAAEGSYQSKKRTGTWVFYDIDGNVLSREEYANDKRNGKSVTYYDNGRIAEEIYYVADVKEGEWKQFYEDGKPKLKGSYKAGLMHGQVLFYSITGKIHIKGRYNKGLMAGKWHYFNDKMKVEKTEVWVSGKMKSTTEEKKDSEGQEN